MRAILLGMAVALGGCSELLGIGDLPNRAEAPGDAPSDHGPSIVLSGDIRVIATQAVPETSATVDVIRISDGAQLATITPDASNAFSVRVPIGGEPLDVYLRVTLDGYLPTHAYLVPRLDRDSPDNHVLIATQAGLEGLAIHAHAEQPAAAGFILAQLFAENQPVPGATGAVLPSSLACYSDPSLQPDCGLTLTATADDGLVWFFGVAPGPVKLSGQLADASPLAARHADVQAGWFITIGLEP